MRSAGEIAAAIGLPGPTGEQTAVIESGLSPSLVVAGAGSGKTETMANRAVWLVANEAAAPSQILGLTFTRKAAGELSERVQRRLRDGAAAGALDLDADDVFERPTIATYNSFADGLFRENALLVGRDPESALIGDAAAWRLARRIVVEHGDERLIGIGKSIDQVTEAVVRLSHALADNIASAGDVRRLVEQFLRLPDLPYGGSKRTPYVRVTQAVETVSALAPLTDLAERFAEEKRRRGLVEFSDQVALALAACRRDPSIVESYRERYRVVILDEYQDTSVVQTRLLALLFADHPVMAVGDPHQSIYGWRGASADNLSRFGRDFSGSVPAASYTLSTSWRNDTVILDAANALVEPLRRDQPVPVPALGARPGVQPGVLDVSFEETIDDEAARVADWMHAVVHEGALRSGPARSDPPPTAAILFRVRRHMDLFARALGDRGVPHRILGLGGLLSSPEITDLVAALRVCHDPTAGSSLIRVLAGPRWRIGVRDLRELRALASWLERRDVRSSRLSDEVIARIRASVAADGSVSIVDALDALRDMPDGHVALEGFSQQGLSRLRDAAHLFRLFRSRAGVPVLDFITLVTTGLRLDLEVVANPSASSLRTAHARLHAFTDEISSFLASEESPTLGSVLAWIDRAERQDMMGPRSESAEPGEVQLLTMHGSKGLEWDAVAVVRMVEREFPAASKDGRGWLSFGELPYDFRGDSLELPALAWRAAETQQQVDAAVVRFSEELAERHALEERRLAYVALTRARSRLLVSGSFWAEQKTPRRPSAFLRDLEQEGIIEALPDGPRSDENPLAADEDLLVWPRDPLGSRRRSVERAAHLVTSVASDGPAPEEEATGAYAESIDLLLAERAAREIQTRGTIPSRIAASRFKDYLSDADAVVASIERPVPERPYRQTRLGTLFHSWVEQRFGATGSPETIDALLEEMDLDEDDGSLDTSTGGIEGDDDGFAALRATFERSEWADLRPIEVEREIHAMIAGRIVVCKLDAVYDRDGVHQIVDWKTGRPPKNDAELEERQIQLALYRLAYAAWAGIEPEAVDAVFYYVGDDEVIRPRRFYSEEELRSRWEAAVGSA
ncbi:DNA helicase-2/ATP-dependent DNA helicase PcrA [Labedella gwakjiensis]|uniref:DNA 3'-5' helicase n=2 Tax=Labedella gwakjiensis TaxID=390269 RepID=A0A2P8H108_9MICO|nr:ATP-dependent DNA helicase [Labedella gwakjiensis]PSL39896.1 DNA helicase-2/ATP-dependent DNA helicase PcrA [Labedella gwakjiensis]RUQ87810.1 ATP-dependent helicase [Labedella gwakjiensis]